MGGSLYTFAITKMTSLASHVTTTTPESFGHGAQSVLTKLHDLPGKSGVTPCKHFILDRLLGREVGVLSRGMPPVREALFYDMTAGDGVPYVSVEQGKLVDREKHFENGCSPGIFLRHMTWLAHRRRVPFMLTGYEKQSVTHAELIKNTNEWLADNGWEEIGRGTHETQDRYGHVRYLHANSQDFTGPGVNRDASCFVYNDPNHIEDWSLTSKFLHSCPKFTTSLSTLGCNVGGLKRIDEEKRREWFFRVEILCDSLLQGWHDACLFSIGGAGQWAYLITAPEKWRDEITQECLQAASKLEKKIPATPQVVWRKLDPAGFYELERFLFLTKAEYTRGVQL